MLGSLRASGRGLELADSITADAHKWLNVPYDCGIAFTRHVALHERAFSADAPYVPMERQLPAFMNRG
ncbi:pyridoxal-dependent decarboxylase [Pseudomonas sp. PCH446]